MKRFSLNVVIAALIIMGASDVFAHGYTAGSLKIEHPYVFTMQTDDHSGIGFLSTTNAGQHDDKLLSVSSPACPDVQMIETITKDGVVTEHEATGGMIVPAKGELSLRPGGAHLLFSYVHSPFAVGDRIKAILHFEKAGDITVEFKVSTPSLGKADDDHAHHEHVEPSAAPN